MSPLLENENCIGVFASVKVILDSLKAFSVLTEQVMMKQDMNLLITYLNKTSEMFEACTALLLCQHLLLQNMQTKLHP